jgi:hypothetical protein
MISMNRTAILALVALGAVLAGAALSTNARRLQDDDNGPQTAKAASPQRKILNWNETYGSGDDELGFSVEDLEVLENGWRASVGLENRSSVPYEVGGVSSSLGRMFGLMLFHTGDQAELDEKNQSGTLPAVRPATRFEPALPPILEPGKAWRGTISAPGPLVADSWVRVAFGPLVSVGKAPDELNDVVTWITDKAVQLEG